MNMSIKKRMALGAGAIATVAAVGTLVAGVTFGFFSASQTADPSTFTAGTVTLQNPASASCTINPMVPGDSSTGYAPTPAGQTDPQTAACTFDVDYIGTVPAYLAVDLSTTGTNLYDGTATGLQFQIADNNGGSYATAGVLNGGNNLFVDQDAAGTTHHTITVNYALPTTAGNSYQGLNTTLHMTVHAVQAGNNGTSAGCTAGAVCSGISTWS
jgi:predicted ribosomally synthesized peptide with SipW-like signal peptide